MKILLTKRLMLNSHSRFSTISSLLLLFFFLISSSPLKAQMQDLAQLAEGELQYYSTLYDDDGNVFGYFYIYERNKEKTFSNMEFVFMDKNLNVVSNGEYKQTTYKRVKRRYYDCTLIGDKAVLTVILGDNYGSIFNSAFQVFSLKDKTVSDELVYTGTEFVKLPEDQKVFLKTLSSTDIQIVQAFSNKEQNGYFITQHNIMGNLYHLKDFKFFDTNQNQKWSYVYNEKGIPREYNDFSFLHVKGNNIYLLEKKVVKGTPVEYKISALNFATGEKMYDYIFETEKDEFSKTINAREVDNELMICGNYSPYDKKKDFQIDENMGFYRIILDKTGKEVDKTFLKWSDVADTLDIDERGRVDKNFRLQPIKVFFFNDKSISILTEKYKPEKKGIGIPLPIVNVIVAAATYRSEKTTDFILFNLDKNMKLTSTNVIEKDLAKFNSSDYLFSQYIKDETGAVFFYSNDIKDKDNTEYGMILGINTIIDGKLTEEKIPIYSKKKYAIQPIPAKEGYIMLREFNENDRYNQVRLERLNY